MDQQRKVLVLGASYGSLFATKLVLSGHLATLVCTSETADLINTEGTVVRFPVREREEPIEVASGALPGRLRALPPEAASPTDFDLVVLAMQEPQYGAIGVRDLMSRVAAARVPCIAIMNMPPLPFLARVPGLSTQPLLGCFTEPSIWQAFDPALMTLASPDPQAFRPPLEPKNILQVSLPTNFKVASFEHTAHNQLLRQLASDIDDARFETDNGPIELPVKLRVHDSIFVPMAKWSMLLTGNYRCIRPNTAIPIRDAVHSDIATSREVYDWVGRVCMAIGATPSDLVPFEKYATAAKGLSKPSSAARALLAGATRIERVDCLVRLIAEQQGLHLDTLDKIVELVDRSLARNREQPPIAERAEDS